MQVKVSGMLRSGALRVGEGYIYSVSLSSITGNAEKDASD